MKRLPQPKQGKKTYTVLDQVKMGLCCYVLGLLFTSLTGSPLFQYVGHLVYWGIFLVNPAVPWNISHDPMKIKKFKLGMRAFCLFMILYPLNQWLPLE